MKEKFLTVFSFSNKYNFCLFFLICFLLVSLHLTGQDFTLITTGDIVNDGGWNYACCWADFNGDGYDDLFVCNNDANNGKHNFLYFNNGDGTFTKLTEGEIITDGNSSYGCTAADYDNDGDIDLFVSNYNENNCLYNNNGEGTFTKVLTGPVVNNVGKSTGCEWADYDLDGWLDLFVCNRDEVNFLYQNNGDGTFTRITTGTIATEVRNSGASIWGDFNGDGYPDLIVANAGPNYNSYFLNNGDGTFSAVTGDPVVSDHESFDLITAGDLDGDGDLDVLAAPGMLPAYSYDLYLYLNNGDGSFLRLPGVPHAGINAGGGCSFTDIDNDGDLDILVDAYDGNNIVLLNDGAGNLTQLTTGVLVNSGNYNKQPGWTDYDRDGDLDLFLAVNNYFGGNNKFFQNNGNGNSWLEIACYGTISNTDGIGSRISVTATIGGLPVTQVQEVTPRHSLITHFGLGDATQVDQIEVQWPSGLITTLSALPVNIRIDICEELIHNPPLNLTCEILADHVLLNWDTPAAGSSSNLLFYHIYLDGEPAGQTPANTYELYDLISGVDYQAGVSAVYESGESQPAELLFTYTGTYSPDTGLANDLQVLGNSPNPFNPQTTILFQLPADYSAAELQIFNARGQLVLSQPINPSTSDPIYSITWNGRDAAGREMPAGVYLYRIAGECGNSGLRKMLLLK